MKNYIIIALLWLSIQTNAQVSMTVQLPPTGVLQKAQLWNILLVSASSSMNVFVELRITDAETNQPVLTGVSRSILLNKGAKQLQAGDVSPVTYEYLSVAADRNANGLLTAGNYIACYSLFQESGEVNTLLAEDCLPFTVEPVSPPLLNSPADESVVEGNLPQFTWLPPTPITIYSDLNYTFTIVELHTGQSAAEAIQANIPVYRSVYYKDLFLNYPVSAVTLDTSKTYAWTVTANNGNTFSAQTDVWTFKIKPVTTDTVAAVKYAYVQLKKEIDGSAINCSGAFQCGYTNDANDSIVIYEIVSLNASQKIVKTGTLSVKPGMNLLEVDFGSDKNISSGQSYLFRLQNRRREKWQMKFYYQKK
ncbi:hypothetical protein [Chitinophaga sp. LS1]|uniref:hypothetical protein n=1 Tax=Chitinophaga sp. LS1 TaxID=3051176 RepID=UPI002AAADFD0|nr:hypothetical protein [Chitinophaga sp. LS1]WPV66726.1 hypothetical protein QQL36_33565 [Chitinophaga sp. LS1]